jgi:hypothetical protein
MKHAIESKLLSMKSFNIFNFESYVVILMTPHGNIMQNLGSV